MSKYEMPRRAIYVTRVGGESCAPAFTGTEGQPKSKRPASIQEAGLSNKTPYATILTMAM
jgi:hypothetical protein